MAKQVYGTIRRVLSDGADGTPWIAELMQSSGEGILYLEADKAPAAGVGDDILAMAEVTPHRDGRLLARTVGLDARYGDALRRLKAGTRGAVMDGDWKVLSGIVAAERSGDIRIGLDDMAISVIRPFAAARPTGQVLQRHSEQGLVAQDAPRYLLDPIVYATTGRNLERKQNALPAGLSEGRAETRGPTMTPAFGKDGETRAWLMYFGEVESCSYTKLANISGRGMLPRADVSASLAHEFLTIHEYAHTLDATMPGLRTGSSPLDLRRMEAFADAFAVTELVMAGRNRKEIAAIVACREAAIIGLSITADGRRQNIGGVEHFSGTAARIALNQAVAAQDNRRSANTAEIARQARRISEQHTISDLGMQHLQKSLRGLGRDASADDVRSLLSDLVRQTGDPALKANAASLGKRLDAFYVPGQQRAAATAIAALHARSLASHQEYLRQNGFGPEAAVALAENERHEWSTGRETFASRLIGRFMPGSASGLTSRISANLAAARLPAEPTEEARRPALAKMPTPASQTPNPWTFSVAGRLQQCSVYAMEAYRINAAVALHGIPSDRQQEAYAAAMRNLSAFVDSVTLRDPTKDARAVRRRFEDNPELEDYLRMIGSYRHSDMRLPADEGKRLQLQAVILAIDPQADLPEMPRPAVQENPIPEFGSGVFPVGDRE